MNTNKIQSYVKMPKSFMLNDKLSPQAKLLFIYLEFYRNHNDNTYCLTRDIIGKELGMKGKTLSKYLTELRNNEYITVDQIGKIV